jgi:hypothetical protein
MTTIDRVRDALARGNGDEALAIAEGTASAGAPREALTAYFAIGEASPAHRARCAAAMGDLHAALGEDQEALQRYAQAASCGAPGAFIQSRIEWLRTRANQDVYLSNGARDPGLSNQRGALVMRPSWLAFIPSEAPRHIGAMVAKAAFSAASGGIWVSLGRPMKPEVLVAWLAKMDVPTLDAHIAQIVEQRRGVIFTPSDSHYLVEKLPLGVRVSFIRPEDRLLVIPAKKALAHPLFTRLAACWPTTS